MDVIKKSYRLQGSQHNSEGGVGRDANFFYQWFSWKIEVQSKTENVSQSHNNTEFVSYSRQEKFSNSHRWEKSYRN